MLNNFHSRPNGAIQLIFPNAGIPLHSMLTSGGYETAAGGRYDFSGLQRGLTPFALFQYTLSGSGKLRFEHQHFNLDPGHAMVLTFPHNNRYWLPTGGEWTFFYLCFHGSAVVEYWHRLIASTGPVIQLADDTPAVEAAANLCARILDGKITSPWQASAEAYALTMQIMSQCLPQPPLGPDSKRLPDPIRRAVTYIRANLRASPDVLSIAAAAGQSRYHFGREFHKHLGLSPGAFLQREKLHAVIELLNTGNAPLADVAPQCGFTDPNYLIRVFKKVYGITPAQFRKRRG